MSNKTTWEQSTLFPIEGGVRMEVKIGFGQESSTLGLWLAVYHGRQAHLIEEHVEWFNYTANGVASMLEKIHERIQNHESRHGIELPPFTVYRDSAPF